MRKPVITVKRSKIREAEERIASLVPATEQSKFVIVQRNAGKDARAETVYGPFDTWDEAFAAGESGFNKKTVWTIHEVVSWNRMI